MIPKQRHTMLEIAQNLQPVTQGLCPGVQLPLLMPAATQGTISAESRVSLRAQCCSRCVTALLGVFVDCSEVVDWSDCEVYLSMNTKSRYKALILVLHASRLSNPYGDLECPCAAAQRVVLVSSMYTSAKALSVFGTLV